MSPTSMSTSHAKIEGSLSSEPRGSYWTPQMTRTILDCVDEFAGDESVFIHDKVDAFAIALDRLHSVTSPQTFAFLDKTKIENKLGKQAHFGGLSTPRELYRLGTRVLDLSKVQKGVYSDEEIQSNSNLRGLTKKKPLSARGSKSNNDEETRKTAISGTRTVNKRGFPWEKKGKATRKCKKSKKAPSLLPQADAQLLGDRARRSAGPVTYEEVSESEDSDDEDERITLVDEPKTPKDRIRIIVPPSVPQIRKTFVCETCEQEFASKATLLHHKASHNQRIVDAGGSKPSSQPCNLFKERSSGSELTDGELNILSLAQSANAGIHKDVDSIQADMMNIQTGIFDATKLFLSSSRIDGSTSIQFNVNAYEDHLKELLRALFGSGTVDNPAEFDARISHPDCLLKRFEVLLAIIGCAVTIWALNPSPQGETRDGILAEMNKHLHAMSPVFQDNVMEMATRSYLERHVKPAVGRAAHELTSGIFNLMLRFLPAEKQNTNSKFYLETPQCSSEASTECSCSIESFPQDDTTSPSTSTSWDTAEATPRQLRMPFEWPPETQRHPKRMFLESLRNIFEMALNLRVDMEMKGNARYEFRSVLSGTYFDPVQMIALNRSNNRQLPVDDPEDSDSDSDSDGRIAEGSAQKKVLVCLTPIVYGWFRKHDRDGPFKQDATILSKACVHLYDAKQNTRAQAEL